MSATYNSIEPSLNRANFPLFLLSPQIHKESIRTPTMQVTKIPADTAEMMVTSILFQFSDSKAV